MMDLMINFKITASIENKVHMVLRTELWTPCIIWRAFLNAASGQIEIIGLMFNLVKALEADNITIHICFHTSPSFEAKL